MNENFYKKLIHSLPIGYSYHRLICDLDNNPIDYEFLDINPAFENIIGLKRDFVLGKKITEIIPYIKDDEFNWISFYGNIALNEGDAKTEQFSNSLNKWFRIHVSSPERGYFITYFTDITDEKKELEEKLNMLIVSNDIVFELDENYTFENILVSDDEYLFAPRAEVLGQTISDIFPVNFSELLVSSCERARESGIKKSITYNSLIYGDNQWFTAEISFLNTSEHKKFIICVREVTTEKKLEQKIEYERQKLNSIIEGTQIGTWEWNIQSDNTIINERWAEMLGYTLEELLPVSNNLWEDLMHPDDLPESKRLLSNHFNGESEHYFFEFRMRHKDGHWIWLLDRGKIVSYTDNGEPLLMLGTHFDISERKKSEELLLESQRMLRTVLDSIPVKIFWKDRNLNYMGCNMKFAENFGLSSPREIVGLSDYQLYSNEYADRYTSDDFEVIESGLSKLNYEEPSVDSSGNKLWSKTSKIVLKNQSEESIGVMGVSEDITEQKKLELQLKNERNFLKTTLLSIEEGIVSMDIEGNILLLNHVAEKLTGWTRSLALRKSCKDVVNLKIKEFEEDPYSFVQKAIESGKSIDLSDKDAAIVSKDGSEHPIEIIISPVLTKSREVNGAVLAFRDITEKRFKQDRILYLSYHDQLTGLYNRRFFEEELKRLDTPRNLPLSLVMVDVNGLKLINDAFGHMVGDDLLTNISQSLKEVCRADDIISRIGGDEFTLILPNTDAYDAEKISKRIYLAISKKQLDPVIVSASIGHATKLIPEEHIDMVFKRAENNMYKQKLKESKSMRENTLKKILKTFFDLHDTGEAHSNNVSVISTMIGEALNLDSASLNKLKLLGQFHDIGLIATDKDILNKPSSLTQYEWTQVKRHPEVGYQILKSINRLVPTAEYVLSHHERWDGKGYPDGLKGEEIPLYSRILSVADAYDAMISERPYRKALTQDEAVDVLIENSGTQFDPNIVSVFIEKLLKERDYS